MVIVETLTHPYQNVPTEEPTPQVLFTPPGLLVIQECWPLLSDEAVLVVFIVTELGDDTEWSDMSIGECGAGTYIPVWVGLKGFEAMARDQEARCNVTMESTRLLRWVGRNVVAKSLCT